MARAKQPRKQRISKKAKDQASLALEALVHCQELGLSDDECVFAAKIMLRPAMAS